MVHNKDATHCAVGRDLDEVVDLSPVCPAGLGQQTPMEKRL